MSCGAVIVLKALQEAFGVKDVSMTTMQAISGRGDARYPRDIVMGTIYPLAGGVEKVADYQTKELKAIIPEIETARTLPTSLVHLISKKRLQKCGSCCC